MKPNWFVAIEAPFELTFQAPPRVRVFDVHDRHLTVAFLGAVDEGAARRAFALAEAPKIAASLGEPRALGNPRRPSALCALLEEGQGALSVYLETFASPMRQAAGLGPETRPPLPHVTFARVQRRATEGEHQTALTWWLAQALAGRLELTRVALYTWAEDRSRRLFRKVLEKS